MALTVDKLMNDDRFCGDHVLQFLLYLPFGIVLLVVRTFMALILWIASILLPNKWAVRQMLSTLACWTFAHTFSGDVELDDAVYECRWADDMLNEVGGCRLKDSLSWHSRSSCGLPQTDNVDTYIILMRKPHSGVYVKLKGSRDPRCSVMVANYVSCLDSLAASHVLGTISLRKWKVPPFFASTLGIRNAAQFARKQHFAECPSKPVLLQPEGGPTNGKGLLKFTDWPFQMGNRVQPVAITVERLFTNVTVHRPSDARDKFPWSDALWFLWTPVTVFTLRPLPTLERHDDDDGELAQKVRDRIADALQVEMTEFKWEQVNSGGSARRRAPPAAELSRLAAHVREVLPHVPLGDIMRDLASTRSVDVTITNFLEGVTAYTPEPQPQPSTSAAAPSRYVIPVPTGFFPKSAKERQLSFQERKAEMIADARQRYIEKHGLNVALNC